MGIVGSMRYRESGILLHNSRLGPLALASFIREIDRLSWQEILSKPWFVYFEKGSISKGKNSLPLLSFRVEPYSEGNQKHFHRVASPDSVSVSLL